MSRMAEKCEYAEKHSGKCLGYQKSEWNDEPTDQCERCEFYEETEKTVIRMRLIDADKTANEFEKHQIYLTNIGDNISSKIWQDAKFVLWDAPTVDAVPVIHGHWICRNPQDCWEDRKYNCSICGAGGYQTRYCSACGAKMDEKDGEPDEVN